MKLFAGQIIALFFLFAVFTPIERVFALHREKRVFRNGWRTDVFHFLFNRFLTDIASFAVIVIITVSLSALMGSGLQTAVASQPVWIQFIEAVAIANTFGYFAHRLAHTIPFLWRFHAIHHSSEQLDWLAAARVHPLDQVFSRAVIFVPLFVLGFTKEVFGAYLVLALFHGIILHSNIRIKLNFLRGILTTPRYHHWHHSNHADALNKNFAGQFPVLDILFGTYYFPKEITPFVYGVEEKLPKGYFGQLRYPFSTKT